LVLCVDEKSQVQALERTQPLLPLGFGYVEGVTHDYKRHGTTTLFAALDVLTGQVLAQCRHDEMTGVRLDVETLQANTLLQQRLLEQQPHVFGKRLFIRRWAGQ
jgi:hypothetical protein